MSKEKLTIESVAESLMYDELVEDGEEFLRNFLKQLRDELYIKATPFEDSSGYIYSKTLFMSEVDEVFDKYLNEKGGK